MSDVSAPPAAEPGGSDVQAAEPGGSDVQAAEPGGYDFRAAEPKWQRGVAGCA